MVVLKLVSGQYSGTHMKGSLVKKRAGQQGGPVFQACNWTGFIPQSLKVERTDFPQVL